MPLAPTEPVLPGSQDGAPPRTSGRIAAYPRFRSLISGGAGFESSRSLAKWLLVSSAIGIVAGVAAIVFDAAIRWVTEFFLGTVVGYMPPAPAGEGLTVVTTMEHPWRLPLVTTLGGALSGLIVFKLAPEAEGHGTDAAIAAIHHHDGRVRARIPPIKLVASAITIGSGGSAGREGPTAQISAGFGSLLAGWLGLDVADRRIAVAAGIGSGIGAIFRAPLGGALLASEILYIHDFEVEAIIPALIASIVGYTVFGSYCGFAPMFGNHPELALGSPGRARVLRGPRGGERARWSAVRARLLRYHANLPPAEIARVGEARTRRTPRRADRHRDARDPPHGVRLGAARNASDTLLALPLWIVLRPAVREDRRHVAVDRLRRIGRHLRARHGGGRDARRLAVAARLRRAAAHAASSRPRS